ncbi:glycerol-3-phosphate dehydrogenase [Salmonella enterica subsp. enterica serovar Typhimurium]|nr:glycerol-3-phosphate dehydrogenase [Salmonella enterica subsp. enterica serovar Typhimurium]
MQLGGAVKNVIAIGAGMSDGIGFGANARTALITRGLTEMSRAWRSAWCRSRHLYGDGGFRRSGADLYRQPVAQPSFWHDAGQGMDVKGAQDKIGQVVEGYRNTKEVRELAHRFGVEMPITEEIYQVLYCGKNARGGSINVIRSRPQGRAESPLAVRNCLHKRPNPHRTGWSFSARLE